MSKWKIGDWVYTYDKYGLYFKNQVRNIFEYKNKDGSIYFKYQLTGDPNKEWGENEMFRLKRECLQGMKDAGIEEHSLAFATLLKTEDECRELYLKNKALEEENEHLKNGIKMCKSVENFDFVKENFKLTKQLAEKDKEIERLKMAFKDMRCLKNRAIKSLKDTVNELREELADQRHQICEKIKKNSPVYTAKIKGVLYAVVKMYDIKYILDQTEKGE